MNNERVARKQIFSQWLLILDEAGIVPPKKNSIEYIQTKWCRPSPTAKMVGENRMRYRDLIVAAMMAEIEQLEKFRPDHPDFVSFAENYQPKTKEEMFEYVGNKLDDNNTKPIQRAFDELKKAEQGNLLLLFERYYDSAIELFSKHEQAHSEYQKASEKRIENSKDVIDFLLPGGENRKGRERLKKELKTSEKVTKIEERWQKIVAVRNEHWENFRGILLQALADVSSRHQGKRKPSNTQSISGLDSLLYSDLMNDEAIEKMIRKIKPSKQAISSPSDGPPQPVFVINVNPKRGANVVFGEQIYAKDNATVMNRSDGAQQKAVHSDVEENQDKS